jgi:hypothetical protein
MKKIFFYSITGFFILFWASGCERSGHKELNRQIREGERLAQIYCTSCHQETPPELLDKNTWVYKVLPKMGPRLGMHQYSKLYYESMSPWLVSRMPAMTQEQWESIVNYFYVTSPDSLPAQQLDPEPIVNGATFSGREFSDEISPEAIITLLEIDSASRSVFACDVYNNLLYRLDFAGNLLDTLQLASPPTAMHIRGNFFDVTLAGILHPNNEQKGQIVRYHHHGDFMNPDMELLIDKLYRPVASLSFDLNYDGFEDYLVCEYGNDFGRLSIYFGDGIGTYTMYILENNPGSIMVKLHDMNKDGLMDIVALFAQGDEKIMIYYNDGSGNFRGNFKLAARFPAVYGSMYFDLHDFNKDGFMDIVYVNGDNFDYSQILKPYHGVRILENDGADSFIEKYFYPVYGAARAEVADFDLDGDSDIIVSSNFSDKQNNPERGIIYFENQGAYTYTIYSFDVAAQNQWNVMDIADLDEDGDLDIIIGAMNLQNVFDMAGGPAQSGGKPHYTSQLIFENLTNQ